MSLINDALKKAQKMRHEETLAAARNTAGAGGQEAPRSRLSAGLIALISGGTALAVCAAVLAGLVLLRGGRQASAGTANAPEPVQAPLTVAKTPDKEGPADRPSVTVAPVQTAATPLLKPAPEAPADNGPVIALPSSTQARVAGTENSPAAAAATPVPVSPAVQDKTPAAQPAPVFVFSQPEPDHSKPNPASQRFVDRIRLTGIRKTASGAKVMMNEKVYRINDVVDQTLGLRLIEAESDKLVFTDEYGHRYVRNFLP